MPLIVKNSYGACDICCFDVPNYVYNANLPIYCFPGKKIFSGGSISERRPDFPITKIKNNAMEAKKTQKLTIPSENMKSKWEMPIFFSLFLRIVNVSFHPNDFLFK